MYFVSRTIRPSGPANFCYPPGQALDRNLIQQISHLQLITVSKDKAIAKDPREGNWCWFELGIVRGKPRDSATKSSATKEEEESLCWMSHENAFMTEEFEWVCCTPFSPPPLL